MVDDLIRGGGPEEDQLTLKVGGGGKDWDLPFREVFEVLEYRFQHDGKGTQGVEKTLRKRMGSWFSKNKMPAGDQPCLQHCTKQ